MSRLARRARSFPRDERGSLAVETVVIFPILAWCYMASFVWFDAFRAQALNDKATFAIADMISRETEMISPQYLTSLLNVHDLMTDARGEAELRVSQVYWDGDRRRYFVSWSDTRRGTVARLRNRDVNRRSEAAARMPMMSPGEKMILVETWLPYEPLFNVGLGSFEFDGWTVIRPRYAPQVCYDRTGSGDVNEAKC
ncbi:hypothetical protein OG2516_06332 [Oceanicola granulosus HTCC2516]|uniref:Pilus assembly protein n=1 Tax=Oceanicola granulosus (strain ATCC BAA-861 / DSM 15982 / KCTC 12143 / HTCC2516) TaxID=314256 RepID=Q2CD98_OCEGH|nr:hypothetical protein [Oceanicola granulosus]EAR50692.1 hypothetical protein OG2516_06332 [Oceanicola granulosus HTCC2516]